MPEPTTQEDLVTLGDKNVELSTFDRYKGRKGQTDLIAIVSSNLIRANVHWAQQKSFRCISTKTERKICCEQGGEPSQKFGLTLFQYAVDQDGVILDATKCSGKVRLWLISEARYEELSTMHKSWPLLDGGFEAPQHDITIKCKDDQFQRMDFIPNPKAQWKQKEHWYKAIKDKELKAKERLKMALGRAMTEQEIKELFGQSAPVLGTTANAGDLDMGSVLDE